MNVRKMSPFKNRPSQGQQLIEYMLLFAIVVILVLWFISPRGPFRQAVNQAIDMPIELLGIEANKVDVGYNILNYNLIGF